MKLSGSHLAALLAAAAISLAPAAPIFAQDTAVAVEADPYDALVDIFQEPETVEQVFQNSVRDLRTVWLGDAEIAALEAQCPGLVDAMIAGSLPMMRRIDDRANREFRNALRGIMAANLTPEEAVEAAAFFNSPDGQMLIGSVTRNSSNQEIMREATYSEDGTASEEAWRKDKQTAARRVVREIDPETGQRISRVFRETTWGPKLIALRPQMDSARLTIFNAPLSPEEDAELQAVMITSVEDHYATCS